jgi:hypothetical protein
MDGDVAWDCEVTVGFLRLSIDSRRKLDRLHRSMSYRYFHDGHKR